MTAQLRYQLILRIWRIFRRWRAWWQRSCGISWFCEFGGFVGGEGLDDGWVAMVSWFGGFLGSEGLDDSGVAVVSWCCEFGGFSCGEELDDTGVAVINWFCEFGGFLGREGLDDGGITVISWFGEDELSQQDEQGQHAAHHQNVERALYKKDNNHA